MNISGTLSRCRLEDIEAFVHRTCDTEQVEILDEPSGAMVMMKHRDPLEKTPFYLGEVFVTQCTVKVSGHIGYGCVIGSDVKRAMYAAICDAVWGGDLPLKEELCAAVRNAQSFIDDEDLRQAALVERTRVDFVTRPE